MNLFPGHPQRILLDETSWLEHLPGWLHPGDAASLLANLIANARWERRERWMAGRQVLEPRLTAEYNDLAEAPDPALPAAARALSEQYQVPYDGLWINFYRFRVADRAVLAPGAVAAAVPIAFQRMVGFGDLITAALALIALAVLRARLAGAIALAWTVLVVGMADTINAIIQSMRYSVFNHALGVNWVIVTIYVPAPLVSSALILWQLLRSPAAAPLPATVAGNH